MSSNHPISKRMSRWMFALLLCCINTTAWADDLPISYEGDHYVINVDSLHPDKEMTLMDVLMICPEPVSINGKTLGTDFILAVNDIEVLVDNETFLQMTKASEVESLDVYINPSVSQTVGGVEGIVNINFKKDEQNGTTGKVALEAGSNGNGKVWVNTKTQRNDVEIRGYALVNQQFNKGETADGQPFSSRKLMQGAHVNIDWDITEKDNLIVKFYQHFNNSKEKFWDEFGQSSLPETERLGSLTFTYTHALNDIGTELKTEGGSVFIDSRVSDVKTHDILPYFFTELYTPLFHKDLTLLTGWEIDYENNRFEGTSRQQYLKNDFYVQLCYNHGPWLLTLGDRFTLLDYWNHNLTQQPERWSHHRTANTYLASIGYRWGRHYIHGSFNRDFYVPSIENFYEDYMGSVRLNDDYRTNLVWRTELRYTYQQPNLVLFCNASHTWKTDMPLSREEMTSIKTSASWNKGNVRITAGASFFHHHVNGSEWIDELFNNYYLLKLMPTLLLDNGFRLSASLVYNSKQKLYDQHAWLSASVKVNKDFGKHWNVYVDLQNLAGQPTIAVSQMSKLRNKRAFALGCTYRF